MGSVDGGTVMPVSMAPVLIPMYGIVFDAWACRGLVAVASDCDLAAYDEWLVRYARDWVGFIERIKHPERGTVAAGVHQALHGQIAYWKSEARKQLHQQEESVAANGIEAPSAVSTTDAGAAARRGYRKEIKAYMKEKGLRTNTAAAKHFAIGVDILKSIMSSKGKLRCSGDTLNGVLEKIGLSGASPD